MATAVFGRKKQMTQAFQDDGTLVGVTVIEVEPNLITAVRTPEADGYTAVQVGFGQPDPAGSTRPGPARSPSWIRLRAVTSRSSET